MLLFRLALFKVWPESTHIRVIYLYSEVPLDIISILTVMKFENLNSNIVSQVVKHIDEVS